MQFIINLRPDDVERFLAGEEVTALIVDPNEIERELEEGFFVGQRYKVRLKGR